MKKAYLIHGWGSSSKEPWFMWLERELRKNGWEVHAYDMPNTEEPKIEDWVSYLQERIDSENLDEHTFFVGHSIGAQTVLRYLEKLHKHKKIGGCVFVSPWLDLINLEPEELEIAHPWINSKIDFGRILDHDVNFACIFSDDDPYVHLDEAKKFEEKLGAKIIVKKGMGHFDSESGVTKIQEVLEALG